MSDMHIYCTVKIKMLSKRQCISKMSRKVSLLFDCYTTKNKEDEHCNSVLFKLINSIQIHEMLSKAV